MKTSPTLLDAAIRSIHKKQVGVWPSLMKPLTQARRFVLDESMSGFLAQLRHSSIIKDNSKRNAALEQYRRGARLPHALTWIEYDARAYKRYCVQHYPDSYRQTLKPWEQLDTSGDDATPRVGWLLDTHPKMTSAFRATLFAEGENENVVAFPFSFAWTVEDNTLVFQSMAEQSKINELLGYKNLSDSEIMTGCTGYRSPYIAYSFPYGVETSAEATIKGLAKLNNRGLNLIQEFMGEMHRVMVLLATLNDLPVKFSEVVAAKGYVAKGSYKKFLGHTTVTLTVPARQFRAVAQRVLAVARRKRHPVRGHWRIYNNDKGVVCTVPHDWQPVSEGHHECLVCKSRRTWIAEHERGDASLGYVTHDYNVTHPTE